MRKFLLLLLATAAVPAMAQDGGQRRGWSHEHSASENRPARGDRGDVQRQQQPAEPRARNMDRGDGGQRFERRQMRVDRSGGDVARPLPPQRIERAQRIERIQRNVEPAPVERRWRDSDRVRSTDWQARERRPTANWGNRSGSARMPEAEARRFDRRWNGSERHWSRNWRNDRRYDWRWYRDRNRSHYRLGRYWDPFGYRYQRFAVGWNMYPDYYSSRYWIDDPWDYRLPPAYGPYRWVRYWDDALLVNIYTGEVVDVIYSFFW